MDNAEVIGAEVDFRSNYSAYQYPTDADVTDFFRFKYPEDYSLMVKRVPGGQHAVYKVESDNVKRYVGEYVHIRGEKSMITADWKHKREKTQNKTRIGSSLEKTTQKT